MKPSQKKYKPIEAILETIRNKMSNINSEDKIADGLVLAFDAGFHIAQAIAEAEDTQENGRFNIYQKLTLEAKIAIVSVLTTLRIKHLYPAFVKESNSKNKFVLYPDYKLFLENQYYFDEQDFFTVSLISINELVKNNLLVKKEMIFGPCGNYHDCNVHYQISELAKALFYEMDMGEQDYYRPDLPFWYLQSPESHLDRSFCYI